MTKTGWVAKYLQHSVPGGYWDAVMVLGVLHAYTGWHVGSDLPGQPWGSWTMWTWLVASMFLIPAAFNPRRNGKFTTLDRTVSWSGFVALGVLSSLVATTFLRDIGLGVAGMLDWYPHRFVENSASAVVAATIAMTGIGFWGAMKVARVVSVEVQIDGLDERLQGFTIAQISDLHVGQTIRNGYVRKVVAKVNSLKADLIVLTGDLVDGTVEQIGADTEPLAELRARHGSTAILGNHELFVGALPWIAEFRRLGMKVLLNEHHIVSHDGARLVIAGVTDYGTSDFIRDLASDPRKAAGGAPMDVTRILLAHQPRSIAMVEAGSFALQLSGHTHGGQMWPLAPLVLLQQPVIRGLHRINGMWLYVNRGTGFWGPPKRLFAPSEITKIILRRA